MRERPVLVEGSLVVESSRGKGTGVRLTVPVAGWLDGQLGGPGESGEQTA